MKIQINTNPRESHTLAIEQNRTKVLKEKKTIKIISWIKYNQRLIGIRDVNEEGNTSKSSKKSPIEAIKNFQIQSNYTFAVKLFKPLD